MGIVYFGGDVHANILDNISEDLRGLSIVFIKEYWSLTGCQMSGD